MSHLNNFLSSMNYFCFPLSLIQSIFSGQSGFRYCPTFVGEMHPGKVLEAHFIGYQGEDFYGKVSRGIINKYTHVCDIPAEQYSHLRIIDGMFLLPLLRI